jgi:hypothetical protein
MATVDSERLWELVESKNLDSFFRIPGQLAVVTAHPMLQDTSGSTIKAETDLLPSSVRVGTNNVLIVAILRMGFTETGRPTWNEFIQHISSCEMRSMYLEQIAELDNKEEKNKDRFPQKWTRTMECR